MFIDDYQIGVVDTKFLIVNLAIFWVIDQFYYVNLDENAHIYH